ncbi:hypothetical protein MSPP1_000384 [Malassezia sp. CBS 17886]|nr:hypothetical protein MSPP1_000384 [Malassezia sp. CBS 17886]
MSKPEEIKKYGTVAHVLTGSNTVDQSEQLLDDAKTTAHKVGGIISKEAEEFEDRAKEAGKNISKSIHSGVNQVHTLWDKFAGNPRYWLSTLSAVNIALLGTAGYYGYQNRDQVKSWDKRVIGAIVVGVAAVLGGESFLSTKAVKKETKSTKKTTK